MSTLWSIHSETPSWPFRRTMVGSNVFTSSLYRRSQRHFNPQYLLVFVNCNIEIFEDHAPGILQNIPQIEVYQMFLINRSKLYILGRNTTEVMVCLAEGVILGGP